MKRNPIVRLLSAIWSGIDGFRKILHLLLLLVLFGVFFGAMQGTTPTLPDGAALLIQPAGAIVEEYERRTGQFRVCSCVLSVIEDQCKGCCSCILRILQRFREKLPARIICENGLEILYDWRSKAESLHLLLVIIHLVSRPRP